MTWERKDIVGHDAEDDSLMPDGTAPMTIPSVALAARMREAVALPGELHVPETLRKEIILNGMCDEQTWGEITRLMTRGIQAL